MVMGWLCLLLLAWPARSDYAPQGSDETVFEEVEIFEEPNGTEPVEEELIIQATQSSGSLVVSQGSDLVLADVFQLASQEVAWMKPSYFRLDLLLAEGLSFRKPLPLQCLAARELKQVNPVEEVADEEVSVFSDALLPQRRLQLHAPVEILQKCLQSLTAHVPWNAPITVAEDDFPGPDLMSTVPMNGSVGINSSAMEVLLTFNDWVQPGEGDIQIIDCGFDDLCGQVGTLDDSVVNISVHDTRSVIFFKNLVWVRYSGLVDLHQHLFHVPEGSIKDISGVSFRGLAAEDYTFRTGPILEGTSSNNDSNSTSDPVFTVELPLETNPYVKSTRPIWAEAGANPVRPEEEPDIPFYVERCYLNETNCSSYNGSNCSSWENVSTLGVCGLNERSGMGFLPLEQLQLWRKPWHWLQAAADGSSLLVQLEVKTANSPVLIKARSHVLNATAGVATLLATLEGEEPFMLEDDEATTLYVEVILEPYGEISVSPTAWRRWGGRVNVTFDFPRVQPDWGSLGQGNFSTTTVEGRPASSLNFHGGLQSVQAALGNLTYTAPRDFQGLALMKVVISDGDYLRDELLLVQVAPNPQAPAAVGVPGNVASIPSILTLYNFSSTAEMEPQVSLRHGGAQTAMANTAHHVNVTVVADLDSEDSARVYVKAPFGQLSFPELDAIMDEAGPGLTEFFADGEYDATEAEFVSKASARDGVWPRISAYESPVGAGFTVVGTVAALNRVLGQLQFTPPADSPNSGSLEVSLLRTPSVEEYETTFPLDDGPVAVGNLAVEIGALSKSQYTCFIGGPAATFVNLGEDARNLGVTVEPEVSASAKVTTAIADELHEFRVSVQRGSVSLDVNKFPAARICPPFFPDVGGCAVDEADAWVIYGRIADAALAIESLVYTGPYGYSGQDRMRITGSCSEVGLEVLLNIIKSYLPPAIRCCEDSGMEVHQGVEPAAVPPCALDNNAYGEIPSVAQVTYSSDIGQLAFWPVEGLYFDRGMEASPMHNVSSQIVASGPGEVMRRNLGSKLALLHIPETETRLFGRLVLEVLDVRSGLSSTASCPIQVIPGRMEYHDMPVPADDTTTDQDSGMQNSTEKDAMVEQAVSTAPVVQLRVLSASAVVEAAGSVYLAALALAADAERGLNAVEGDLEVWLSSGQGVLEIDVAALVGSNSAYLADASGGSLTTSKLEQDQVAESGMAMGGQPFRVPSANSRLAYVDPSRPADPENRTLLDPRGPQRPSRVLWSGRSLQLRGSAVNLHQTLSSVKYTADEQAGGWDTVTVTMGRQKGEVPVYIIRRAGAVVLKGRPLERLTVGQILKPDIRLELSPLVRAEDTFSALVACSHCGLALWMYANKMEVISSSLEFAGNTSELEAFLADLTYVPEEGFTGTDWLQVFVQGGRLQAASQVASSAELGMAVSVEQVEKVVPPAAVLMPERFSIFEDSATDPQIQIRVAMVAAEPSDVDDDTDCLNASEADMWLPQDPLALRGSVQLGSFALEGISSMPRLRTMTSCPDELAGDQGHATDGHEQLQTFAQLVDGQQVAQFCVKGHPLALSEFASRLRYQPAQHWAGSEPMRITLTAADDAHVVHAAAQSWVLVQSANDPPSITAIQPAFEVQIGNSVQLAGINISDADMSDTTRWMTLSVAASIGRLYVEDSFLLAPTGTVEPLSGRLDGDFSLRVQGSGPDLQAFVEKLRFSMSAPPKPYLAPRPLDQPETEAIISYILSDTLGPQAAALRRHQVAGKVVNPQTDEPVAGVDVLLLATDTWHDYPGYTMLSGCDVELKGWDIPDCKTYALNHSYPGFSIGLYRVGGALACCFKTADAETILTNLVFDDTASVHIFQPGGYTVRTQTSALGVYAGIMPTGPAEIYFEKYLYASRNLSIWVSDNIQVGGSADIYLQALAVVTIWRFEVDWSSSSPVDLDAHSFDPWDCHVYFANRQCKHVGSHGLTVTLNRDSRDVLNGKEVITVHQWPCDATQAAIGGYRDVWSCLTYFWVQVFSQNNFADVQGKVSIFREGLLLEEVQLPTTADSFWVGFVLDAGSSIVTSQNQTGGSEAVEGFVSGMYLSTFQMPPAREVRRLSQAGRQVPHWQEQLRKELSSEKEADVAQVDYHKLGGTRKLQSSGQYGGLYVPYTACQGAEECDDFNDFGGGGCSPSCLRESKEVASASETEVRVTVRPLAQVCRIYNAGQHQTLEDTTYHLQQTLLTGDVTNLTSLQIRIQVVDGSIAMKPLIDFYLARGRNDSTWEAIVERETGVRFYPYADNMKDTILTGSHFQASRFLRLYLYIEPDRNFFGNVQVDFTVVSGMAMNHGAEECTHGVVIEVEAVHDDPLLVTVSEDVQSNGFQCVAGSSSCSLAGLSVSDPDCEMTVDGSCFLRVELNVTLGFLRLPGHPDGWQAVFPPLMGHAPGLNAALSRLAYFPPAGPAGEDASLNFTVHRVIQRTMATPPALQPAVASRSLPVHVLAADTAPTVSLASGGAFHGAIFEITGAKPFRFADIVFEPPGAIDTTCIIELEVSRGYLFLGDTEGLWFAGGTMNGESKLRFVSNSTDIRERFLADVRYTWDEHDCATLEEFNITVDSGHHPPLTLAAMLVLPDCQGFQAQWTGGSLNMDEDTEISIGHLHVSTHDPHLFLIVDVKHPGHVPGDCKVVRWPEAVSSFVPGRECHLDGLVNGLNDALPFLVYKPPPDFFGHVQLEFVLFRAEVRDELLGLDFRSSNSSFLVDIEVAGVNDGPMLDVFLDSYTLKEDLEEYLVLGPLFVSDIDAGQHPLSFKFELFSSHEGNLLMLCGLEGVQIEEPRGHLNEDGCLEMGTALVHFNTTVENFNSMQTGPGRLQFKPAPNWHGFARVNITVDDRGSGHGNEFHLLVERSLYLVVEPVIDKPELSHLCTEAMPFLTYGRTCLEVRECFALNATADSADQTISFWLVIEASDPGVSISLEDRAPLQVWREGTSELQAAGLYSNIQEALRALIFHPPPQIFAGPEDPDIFEFNISITAYALGQRFNEPLPFNPGTPGARPEGFPSDMIEFPVVVRRVNRRPFFFVDVPHFSVSQMQDDVRLYGVTVADPDARQNDDMEVEILVDSDSWGGAVAFAGERGTRIQRRMKLRELNRALQELTFVFEDANWFGVTGISVSVSDVGNRGWRVDHYAEMFREDIDPEAQVFYDDHNLFEQCVAYDRSLLGLAAAGGAGATGQPYVWHSPQAYAKLMRETHAYTLAGVNSTEWGPLMATTFLAVHRSFVNEPPRIVLLEPQSGVLNVFEDHANFASFLVRHKAAEFLVERTLSIFLTTSHGRVQSISSSATAKSSVDGKRLEYRASLFELNKFLAQLQFAPDPNYNGPDELVILLTDDEYAVNTSVPIEIASLSDPLSIICPPAVDLFEGQHVVPIGDNISIRDYEPIPGSSDDDSQVAVEIFVGAGGLHLQLDRVLPEMHEELSQVSNDSMQLNRSTPGVPGFIFNTSLAVFRAALKALSFTPYPELYHGVVHLEIRVAAQETHERTKCEIGLIVHPVNTPPVIRVDDKRLLAGTNGGIVKPHKEIPLHGVIQLSDPDEEDFSGGWFVERVHSARLQLRASCGTISFLIAGPQDYVFGVQNGSIAGTEGITFHNGDGFHDTDMDITSTLRNLNLQLGRLFYHSGGGCRGQNITISVELDDLGNFGASMDEMGNYGHPYPIVVTNQVQFQVSEY